MEHESRPGLGLCAATLPGVTVRNSALSYRHILDHIGETEIRLKQGGVRLAAYLDALFAS